MSSFVNDPPTGASGAAVRHFEEKLSFETDVWTVREGMKAAKPDFVLIDVRGAAEFDQGHVPGAINIPYPRLPQANLLRYPSGTTFVVYSAGSHCNRADRAALLLADMELPVKIMIGGIIGWREEGFELGTTLRAVTKAAHK